MTLLCLTICSYGKSSKQGTASNKAIVVIKCTFVMWKVIFGCNQCLSCTVLLYWMFALPRIAVLHSSSLQLREGSGSSRLPTTYLLATHTHTKQAKWSQPSTEIKSLNKTKYLQPVFYWIDKSLCLCFPQGVSVIICSHVRPDVRGGYFWPLRQLWENQSSYEHLH